ncbi:MAG: Hpt domain-containing protein, partial [Gammaproteobacteria bacterium]|nr:Hpt domain-containing protein [Gammaproteobacteria bacterium]
MLKQNQIKVEKVVMSLSGRPEVQEKLLTMQEKFKRQLEGKLAEVDRLWGLFCDDKTGNESIADLNRIIHGLAGSGGTFGAMAVSTVARELE